MLKRVLPFVLAFGMFGVAMYVLHKPSGRLIARWEQPTSVRYDSQGRTLSLRVVECATDWSDFPHTESTFHMYVGHDFPYGLWYRFPFYHHVPGAEDQIKKSTIEWSDDGLTFAAVSGERLFIPSRLLSEATR